ncbi:MAG: hypothetical protein EOO38_15880 [Cytophagaceae bacterium]|nr:MAG: hypothetical protein EOO38_15880 [Cytophagaceae bacterium]
MSTVALVGPARRVINVRLGALHCSNSCIANLAPRTMRGYESQGMLLAASDELGRVVLVNPGDVSAGATVR